MLDCWRVDPEERPSFEQLITRMEEMMTRDTPYFDLNEDYESDASNTETKPESDQPHAWLVLGWITFGVKVENEVDSRKTFDNLLLRWHGNVLVIDELNIVGRF